MEDGQDDEEEEDEDEESQGGGEQDVEGRVESQEQPKEQSHAKEGVESSSSSEIAEKEMQKQEKLLPKKRQFKTKNMRIVDEDTLRMIDVEFIMKQETHMKDCLKDQIMPTQFIRTQELIRVYQLKKHVHSKLRDQHQISINEIQMFIYCRDGQIRLKNEQLI